ncbi:MAG: oligosaccharide flippase family protein [Bacillota bacterium]
MKFSKDNLEFLGHSKNYIFADFFSKALYFLVLPIITRLLSPSDFGVVSVFMALIAVFEIIFELNFRGTISRYYFEKNFDFKSFIGTNLIFLTTYGAILLLILFSTVNFWTRFLYVEKQVVYAGFIVSYIYIYLNILLSYLRAAQKSKEFALVNVLYNTLILVIAVFLYIYLKEDKYLGRVYSTLLIVSVFSIFAIVKLVKLSNWNFKPNHIYLAVLFGIPLLPHSLSSFILAQFDKVIINQLEGSYDTGLYSFAYNVAMIMYVFVIGMDKSWSPMFYKKMNSNDKAGINELAQNYTKYVFSVALILVLFSREIVIIMADKKYHASLSIIPIIIIGYIFVFLYTLYIKYSLYYKKTYLVSICTIIAGIVNVVLNYAFIPKYGYKFAAISTVISYFLLFIFHFSNVKYILKEKTMIKLHFMLVPFILVVLAVTFTNILFETSLVKDYISIIIRLIFLIAALYILFRKSINKMIIR